MKKRSKIIATLAVSFLCLSLIIYGVYALVVNFSLSSSFSFEANGVYVGISGQVYTGATKDSLAALTTDASYTLNEVKNFTAKADGTPDGTKSQESVEAWQPANVTLDEAAPYLCYEVKFKNYSPYDITVIPNNTTVANEKFTMTEDKSKLSKISAGATATYKLNFEVANYIEDIPQTAATVSYTLRKFTDDDIYVDENWFNITSDGKITSFNKTYYTDDTAPEVLVIPETIKGITVTGFDWNGLNVYSVKTPIASVFAGARPVGVNLNSKTKRIIIKAKIKEIPDYCFIECYSLEAVTIPSSVTSIGDSAFDGCGSLKYIKMSGNTLTSVFTLPTATGKVWVTSTSADKPADWTKNVVTSIPKNAGDLYYHQQAAWEK